MAERQEVRVPSEAVQGSGSWVKLRPLTFGEVRRIDGLDSAEAAVRAHTLDWNWVDEGGRPLPPPTDAAVWEQLTRDEFWFLFEALTGRKERDAKAAKLLAHLWTGGGDTPWEYVDLRLCRDVYHCLPSALEAEDARTILTHLEFMAKEARVDRLNIPKKPAAKSPRSKRRR